MTALVFAAPYTPPPPPVPVWVGYNMTWTGPSGARWRLDGSQGVALVKEGLVGLHFPQYERFTSESPSTAGARHRGSRAKERAVEWNILTYADGASNEWLEIDRAFWDSLDVDEPGVWEVTDLRGRTLSLECRLNPTSDHSFDQDPSKGGWGLYQVQLVASRPFWTAPPVEKSWRKSDPVEFFDPAGNGVHISSGASLVNTSMTNPGDVAASILWTFEGPLDPTTVTVDGGAFTTPEIPEGSTLVVDTDPEELTAFLDGEDVSGEVDPFDPHPLPKGSNVPVSIETDGFGTVTARLTPLQRRGV